MDTIKSIIDLFTQNWGTIVTIAEGLVILINAIRKAFHPKVVTMATEKTSVLDHILWIVNPINVFRNIK